MAKIATMTEAGRIRVGEAVTAAESRSAGEIVTIVTGQSDDYADIALIWSIFVAFLALMALAIAPDFYLGIYDRLTGGWVQQWHPRQIFAVALLVASLKFTGMWLLARWRPPRLLVVPGPRNAPPAPARART